MGNSCSYRGVAGSYPVQTSRKVPLRLRLETKNNTGISHIWHTLCEVVISHEVRISGKCKAIMYIYTRFLIAQITSKQI